MYDLGILHLCGRRVKTKNQKVLWALSLTFVKVTGEKMVGGLFDFAPNTE